MASSAGTPGPPSNSSGQGEREPESPPSPSSDSSSPNQGKSSPPPPANSGSNNSSSDGGNKNSTAPSASPPPPSPPPSPSPPPASPPRSNSTSDGNSAASNRSPPPASPPPSTSSSSSAPPASPPPSSSSSQTSPPPSNSSPADQSSKLPPSASGGQSAPPASPPPANTNQQSPSGSNAAPSNNAAADSEASKWTPPTQPGSPPAPVSSTPSGTSTPTANPASNALGPPTDSESSTSKASPQGSSKDTAASSGNTPTASSTSSSPSTSSSSDNQVTIIGATAAGVFVVALIAIFFLVRGRRKRRDPYRTPYMAPPNHFPEKADGYYYSQNYPPVGHSGQADAYYGSQVQPSPMGHSFGSQRGGNGCGGGSDSGGIIAGSISFFTYEELIEITNGFSRDNVIGEGGFGYVYKGVLQNGKEVAVKQLKAGSGQGEREFRAEVEIISRVHHRHLVSLVGYCISDNNRLLIYEFLPNKTLEHHLHGKGMPVLDWSKRLKIALGAAKGLAYLHEDCHPKIIHRDIKTANILLDNAFEAQVADFGLARLNDTTQSHVSTRVMGTFGYLAPEYASSGKLTDRSDVFSFGVVLLELITGRKPIDPTQPLGDESLVEWARPHLVHAVERGNVSELVDPRLEKHYVESEMFRMIEAAAACVRHSAPKRPRMVQVVRALDCEGELSDLSNGVKYGQSTVYDSGQYNQDIMMFRRMALGFDSSDMSGDYISGNASRPQSSEFTSGESESRAMNQHSGEHRQSGIQERYTYRL